MRGSASLLAPALFKSMYCTPMRRVLEAAMPLEGVALEKAYALLKLGTALELGLFMVVELLRMAKRFGMIIFLCADVGRWTADVKRAVYPQEWSRKCGTCIDKLCSVCCW